MSESEKNSRSLLPALGAACIILIGGMLVAIQLRVQLFPWGKKLGADYPTYSPAMFGLLPVAVIGAYLIGLISARLPLINKYLTPRRQFRVLLIATGLAAGLIFFLLPIISQLQLIYFVTITGGLGVLLIVLPARLRPVERGHNLKRDLQELWNSRTLLRLWLLYTIRARYSQMVAGIAWIILQPVAFSLVLVFAFSAVLGMESFIPGVSFVAFFMTSLVPFNFFQSGIQKAVGAVTGKISIISKVYFPREILILLCVGEVAVDFVFAFIAMMAINALSGIWPNMAYIYLFIPLIILGLLVTGLAFFIGTWSALIRDVPQLVGVALHLLFYLTPVIYPLDFIPDRWRLVALLNPLTGLVQAFRDIVLEGRAPEMITLYYPLMAALTLLYLGYAYFKSRQGILSDLV